MGQEYSSLLMTAENIEEAVSLSSQVGWNQTEEDWARLIELNPETCFLFRRKDQVVGTGTLVTYGWELGWIGMVIVDQEHRGMGIGKYILQKIIYEGNKKQCEVIGLDATDQGRPIYERFGFVDVGRIDRWAGHLTSQSKTRSDDIYKLDDQSLSALISLDYQYTRVDRSDLIKSFIHDKNVQGLGINRNDRLSGFLFLRPGLEYQHAGPIVAGTREDHCKLLDAAAKIGPHKPTLIDTFRRKQTSAILENRGMSLQRELTRMTLHQSSPVLQEPEIRGIVSFEWG